MKKKKTADQANNKKEENGKSGFASRELLCPKCGNRFYGKKVCPRCGYTGYFPMTDEQIKRIKWILYPIFLIAAVLIYFLISRSGG